MAESILQTYLNEQHVKAVDESSVDNLKKAITEVKKHLTKKKIEIISFTLVALDPKIRDTNRVVEQVEKIIIKHWKTFTNSVKSTNDKSTTYVRAVILESLNQLAKGDAVTATLVWLTARDVIRYYNLDSEKSVISNLLQELADRAEEKGQNSWGVNRQVKVQEFKGATISIPSLESSAVDQAELKEFFLRASQHTGWKQYSNQTGDNPAAFNQNWAGFFSDKASEGVSKVVNSVLAEQSKSLSTISISVKKSLNDYFAQLQPFFEELNSSFANSITANNKRSQLLWWKQSMYSQSLATSYRSLDRLNAALAMALDLAEQVDGFYPESVDYLLRETLKDVHADQVEEERPLITWLEESSNLHEAIKTTLEGHQADGEERKHLLNALANFLQSGKTSDFLVETGIDKKSKLSASDLSVWLFHGLQAQKLATTK